MQIKIVILNHNTPDTADKLYEQLKLGFQDVELWDSGSNPNSIPVHVTRPFPNIYWAGAWNEIMTHCSGYDVVWMVGGDIELRSSAKAYHDAIVEAMPFGCWSPCIEGRAKPFMQVQYFHDEAYQVRNIEGMAMAVSGQIMGEVKILPEGSPLGFGQDLWFCHVARKLELKNVIDGRVKVFHPPEIGYNEREALEQMNKTFGGLYGANYRRDIFEFSDFFEDNVMRKLCCGRKYTIVTVDDGLGCESFLRIVRRFPESKVILMKSHLPSYRPIKEEGLAIIEHDVDMSLFFKEADVALFPQVNAHNVAEYFKLLEGGVPVVVHVDQSQDAVDHMKNGFIYQIDQWAEHWLRTLKNDKMRQAVYEYWQGKKEKEETSEQKPKSEIVVIQGKSKPLGTELKPLVTVITPTWMRGLEIISRCIDCMKLQTCKNWEQLVCSNGQAEESVRRLVESKKDARVKYRFTGVESKGDFGNIARAKMLEEARGEYVLFFDDDNLILPNYLADMTDLIDQKKTDFVVCDIIHFGAINEKELGATPPLILKGEPVKMFYTDPLQVLVRTEVMKKAGWDTRVGYLSDGATLDKLGASYKHCKLNVVLGIHM